MDNKSGEAELSGWMSTYGLLTSERLLEGFHIHLRHNELASALQNTQGLYFRLLRLPLRNVLNGIILQQAYDYKVYMQKMFVDYLLSGKNTQAEEASGSDVVSRLDNLRNTGMSFNETYMAFETSHLTLIADSQKQLISQAGAIKRVCEASVKLLKPVLEEDLPESTLRASIDAAVIADLYQAANARPQSGWDQVEKKLGATLDAGIKEQIVQTLLPLQEVSQSIDNIEAELIEQIDSMRSQLCDLRAQIYELILKAQELISQLPDYRPDEAQQLENKLEIDFDASIGEAP